MTRGFIRRLALALAVVALFAGAVSAEPGARKRRPLPFEYGRVVIDNYSEKAGLPPVVFDHWLHRAKFTCRLCHVDIGFAMKAGQTDIKAADNIKGYYCGACHNRKTAFDNKTMFSSCSKTLRIDSDDMERCWRCHSLGREVKRDYDFGRLTQGFPRERFGNGVNWEKAEEDGLIKPVDFIPGVSIKKQTLTLQNDLDISPKIEGMPDILFSHKKHVVWNGCELCHPDIFPSVKKGQTKYSMTEIFEGRYCGECHGVVAFPLLDCQRCHSKPVE